MSEPIKNIKAEIWFFDIEYVPCLTTGRRVYDLPADMPDADVLSRMYAEAGAKEEDPQPMLKSVMYRIVSIAALVRKVNGEINLRLFSRPLDEDFNEAKILEGFLGGIGERKPQLVGFATSTFDLTTIFQRAIINRVDASHFCERPNKPWDNEPDYFAKNDWNVDLLKVLGTYGKTTPKLSEIAQACGIPAKVGGDGAQVAQMWFDGKRREIVNYNECDVLTTYLLWLQTVRTCGLLSPDEVESEETKLRNLLIEGSEEKPHLAEFLTKWNQLLTITADEAGTKPEAVELETPALTPDERAELEARVQFELNGYALGDVEEIEKILNGRTLNERSDAELNELIAKYGSPSPESASEPQTLADLEPAGVEEPEPERKTDNPHVARTLSEMISTKQVGMIRGLARTLGRSADSVSTELFNAPVGELSKRSASELITKLQNSIKSREVAA